jgi:hypothetical protein
MITDRMSTGLGEGQVRYGTSRMENNLCAICAKQIDGWKQYADHMKETHNCVLNDDGSVRKL